MPSLSPERPCLHAGRREPGRSTRRIPLPFCGAAPDEPVRGTFSEISGQIVTDPDPDPSRSTATATIALSSVSTGNDERDAHLLSKEAT